MSTAVLPQRRFTAQRRITVPAVRAALEEVVAQHPGRVDPRVQDDLPARYITHGRPNCLVAMVLAKLGFSTGVLTALDEEHPTGSLIEPGVRVNESQHPALRKIHADARFLLQYVQDRQDAGDRWDRIVTDAFKPNTWLRRLDERRRPWLYS